MASVKTYTGEHTRHQWAYASDKLHYLRCRPQGGTGTTNLEGGEIWKRFPMHSIGTLRTTRQDCLHSFTQHPVYKHWSFTLLKRWKDLFSETVKSHYNSRIWESWGGESISKQHDKPHILILNDMPSRNICRYLLQQQGFYSCLVTASKSVKNPNNKCWSSGKKLKCHIHRNSAEITASAPFCRFCSHLLESQEQSYPPQHWKLSSGPSRGRTANKDHQICGNFTQEPGKAHPDHSTQLGTI